MHPAVLVNKVSLGNSNIDEVIGQLLLSMINNTYYLESSFNQRNAPFPAAFPIAKQAERR